MQEVTVKTTCDSCGEKVTTFRQVRIDNKEYDICLACWSASFLSRLEGKGRPVAIQNSPVIQPLPIYPAYPPVPMSPSQTWPPYSPVTPTIICGTSKNETSR